jgi:hypothetical protein
VEIAVADLEREPAKRGRRRSGRSRNTTAAAVMTQGRQLPTRRRWVQPIVRQAITCSVGLLMATGIPSVLAQHSRVVSAHPEWPDFSHPSVVMALICSIVLPPIYFALIYLLWKRRNHFPIAGRGSSYLLISLSLFTVAICLNCLIGLAYPNGVSCPIQTFMLYLLVIPIGVGYVVRGWTLIFRVEIMGFLEETRWRDEKRSLLGAHKQAIEDAAAEEEEATRYEAATNGTSLDRAATEKSPKVLFKQSETFIKIQAAEEEDLTPIQGEWFIKHRRWIEPSFLRPFVAVFGLLVILTLIIVSAFDPDAKWTNDNFRRTGVLADSDPDTPAQFHKDTWLTSPVCLTYSLKGFMFETLLGTVLVPALLWCRWRLTLDSRRTAARQKDQAEVHRLVYGTELEKRSVTKIGKYELDDVANVRREFMVVCLLSVVSSCLYFLLQYYAPEWQFCMFICIFNGVIFCSVVRPLYLSYAISRQHRKMLSTGGKSRGSLDHLPHHRPLYTLKYILRTPRPYEVLLAFLQKEYSSENALFYKEARSFERASKALEAEIPNWPSAMDPDDEEMTDGTIQRVHSSIAAKRMQTFGGLPAVAEGKNSSGKPGMGTRMLSMPPPHRLSPRGVVGGSPLLVQTRGLKHQTSSVELASPISMVRASITELPPNANGDSPLLVQQQMGTSSPSMNGRTLEGDPSAPKVTTPSVDARTFYFSNGSPVLQSTPHGIRQISLPRASLDYSAAAAPPAVVDYPALHAEAARLKAWAIRISELYLIRAAQYEVNIAEDLSKLVLSQIRQLADWNPTPSPSAEKNGLDQTTTTQYPVPPPFPLSTLYKATCIAVFQLIERDSFRRFILTPGFEGLLAKADEDELARVEKQQHLKEDVKKQVDAAVKAMANTPPHIVERRASAANGGGSMLSRLALASVSPKQDASRMRVEDPQVTPRGGTVDEITNCSTTGDSLPGTVPSSKNRRTTYTGSGGAIEAPERERPGIVLVRAASMAVQ